jgi:HlyD family secretion protein
MPSARPWGSIAIGVALVAALGAWLLWPAPEVPEYQTAPVERGRIVSTVQATGAVNPLRSVQVGTYVSGPVLEIDADFNAIVKRGQRIARIDPRTFEIAVARANADLATAEARVARSQAELELRRLQQQRQETLARTSVAAASDLDLARTATLQAKADVQLAESGVSQARAALDEAKVRLGYTEILSPVDGIVVSRNVDVGQTVAASFQTPVLFVIAEDLTRMQVNAQVSEADIGSVREGHSASFTVDAYPGRSFDARVSQVRNAPQSLLNVVTYDVVLDVDNSNALLKPGMTASVGIVTDSREDVLKVPSAALRFHPPGQEAPAKQPQVFLLLGDRLQACNVKPGLSDDQSSEITPADEAAQSDLTAGARVVVRQKSSRPQTTATLPGFGGSRSSRR